MLCVYLNLIFSFWTDEIIIQIRGFHAGQREDHFTGFQLKIRSRVCGQLVMVRNAE